jgi:hypothetical protein
MGLSCSIKKSRCSFALDAIISSRQVTRNPMNTKPAWKNINNILFFATGSGAMCLVSTVQTIFMGTPLTPKVYAIPFIFGGSAGLAIGFKQMSLQTQNDQLMQAIENLQESNKILAEVNQDLEKRTKELEESFAEIKRLQGIIPICAECKKVQDEDGQWKPVELYVQNHSAAQFSHGVCPICAKKLYPNLNLAPQNKKTNITNSLP